MCSAAVDNEIYISWRENKISIIYFLISFIFFWKKYSILIFLNVRWLKLLSSLQQHEQTPSRDRISFKSLGIGKSQATWIGKIQFFSKILLRSNY